MHKCSETRERLTELVLDGVDCRSDEPLAAELNNCAECRTEFEAINATLRMTARLHETAAVRSESYWNDYHAGLRQKLKRAGNTSHAKTQRRGEKLGPLFATLRLCVRSSIPVPVPLAVLIILAGLALILFAIRPAERAVAQPPMIVHVPVEVPVVQERVVTRIVYRDRHSPLRAARRANNDKRAESTFARTRKTATEEIPASLTGFKPTDEVKFTVIKGGIPNEK